MTSDIQTPIEPIVEAPVKKVAAAVEQETAEPQPAVEASADAPAAVAVATLDESYVFVEQGKQMLALGSFDSAAEKLALAVEAQYSLLTQSCASGSVLATSRRHLLPLRQGSTSKCCSEEHRFGRKGR